MSTTVAHVIQSLSRGGPGRSLIAAGAATSRAGIRHRIVSLAVPAPASVALARSAGFDVIARPDAAALYRELKHADIVQVHFWNTPELYAVLASPLPPMRLLLSCRVGGRYAPQVLTAELVAFSDLLVASTPYTAELPSFREATRATAVIPAAGDRERMRGAVSKPHTSFNIGYIGTVDFAKMHPEFVAMSVRVQGPDVRFIVCGSGGAFKLLAGQAAALGARKRFELRGFVEDVKSVMEQLDVFGYPLCSDNYSASELVLQEAMYCGVPPVVLPYGAAARSIVDGKTGIVAKDEDDYVRKLEWLRAHPAERRTMGRAAAQHARQAWDLEDIAARWLEVYEQLGSEAKRRRFWPARAADPGHGTPAAAFFVQSLGCQAEEFVTSLTGDDPEQLRAAEDAISRASAALASADGGGVLHWRRHHPRDPWLRLWAGLVLYGQGRRALAAGEFRAALDLGLQEARVRPYLIRCMRPPEVLAS